jgi:capsular exopolysaccharide synthesis family protein
MNNEVVGIGFEEERQGAARYLHALREHWLLILGIVVVAVAAAIAYSLLAPKRYEAEADILVTPVSAGDDTFLGISLLRESADQTRTVLTAARLIKTPQIADGVRERLGLAESRKETLDSVEVTPLGQANIVSVTGVADTAERAAELANGFAEELVEQRTTQFQDELSAAIDRLESRLEALPQGERNSAEAAAVAQRLAELQSLVGARDPTLQISSEAVPPESASWPRPALSVAVALLAALLLGSGLALVLELVSPRLTREDELVFGHRLPILARVPRLPGKVARGFLSGREPLPAEAREAYRTLRASLATAGSNGEFPRSILVTSAMPGEGKTMTAGNLATTLSLAGMTVVLVDGDLRRPMVATLFRVPARPTGLASVLAGHAPLEDALVDAPGAGKRLRLLLASTGQEHLIDLLQPRKVERVLNELLGEADVVVVDSPPLTQVADALALADAVEAVVIAVRLGTTRRDKLAELRRMLLQRGIAPVGFVVTGRRKSRGDAYYGKREGGSPRAERRPSASLAGAEADPREL